VAAVTAVVVVVVAVLIFCWMQRWGCLCLQAGALVLFDALVVTIDPRMGICAMGLL
jgi:hypothetical protein